MSRNNLELVKSNDKFYLNCWDNRESKDQIYILKNEKAYRQTWVETDQEKANPDFIDTEKEPILTEVDLVKELQTLATKLDEIK